MLRFGTVITPTVSLALAFWVAWRWFLLNNFFAVHFVQAMALVLDVWMKQYIRIKELSWTGLESAMK